MVMEMVNIIFFVLSSEYDEYDGLRWFDLFIYHVVL